MDPGEIPHCNCRPVSGEDFPLPGGARGKESREGRAGRDGGDPFFRNATDSVWSFELPSS